VVLAIPLTSDLVVLFSYFSKVLAETPPTIDEVNPAPGEVLRNGGREAQGGT
jgi:hypothetical protein